jgi:DNA polymerase-3 subunit delta'
MAEIIGQGRAVALLKRGLAMRQLAHAYLFSGPSHVGKMTLALWLAQALECPSAEAPCGECPACDRIAQGKHTDVRVISLIAGEDGAEGRARTAISVEQIEQIQHEASLPPLEGRCRIFIVEAAELLSGGAANRLLKTLEEPEPGVFFFLLTSREELVPPTVISRCQRIELMPVLPEHLEARLSQREGLDPDRVRLASRLAHGCPGWAVRALLDDSLLKEYAEEVARIISIIESGYEGRLVYAADLAARFGHDREVVNTILRMWLDVWRDIILIKAGCPEAITNLNLEVETTRLASGFSLFQVRACLKEIRDLGEQLRRNVNPRLALDVFLLGVPKLRRIA